MTKLVWRDCGEAKILEQVIGNLYISYAKDGAAVNVIVNREMTAKQKRWHLSISTATRYPTWEEIHAARYEFIPDDVCMAMILPPKSEYVNVCSNCFHLWEVDPE